MLNQYTMLSRYFKLAKSIADSLDRKLDIGYSVDCITIYDEYNNAGILEIEKKRGRYLLRGRDTNTDVCFMRGRAVTKNNIILAACDCAESVFRLIPENEKRPRKAVETTRAFVAGEAIIEEVRDAASASWYAANAAWSATADRAAATADRTAAYAAYAAANAAAAAAAVAAVAAAAAAADTTAYIDANNKKQKELADIVRKRIPWEYWQDKILK